MEYTVYFKVLAEYGTKISANSKKEALQIARKNYEEASLGDFEFLDELDVETLIFDKENNTLKNI